MEGGRRSRCSVVVPTCHRPDRLAVCLERLAPGGQTLGVGDYEVIVTDDSRDLTSREVVREGFPWAKWVPGPRRGPAANRNHGAREASGEWLVFVDDDCQPEPRWLEELTAALWSGAAEVVEGRTICPGKRDDPFQEQVENLNGGVFWSCNLGLSRDAFVGLGGFDEDFSEAGGEDMEFAWRIRARGLRTRFAAEAVVLHPPRRVTWGGLWWRTWMIRWMPLYWIKTGQAPPLEAGPVRVYAHLVGRTLGDWARTTVHLLRRGEREGWRRRWFFQLWKGATLPLVLPYLCFWESRFRRALAQRAAAVAASTPSLARG